jgi:putative membrane protein
MAAEALLSYAHLLAILTLVVFIASEAALCRPEWLNAQVVERLVTVDRVYGIAAGAVFLTGLARILLGAKGAGWYGHNWLLWTKLGLFVVVGLLSTSPRCASRPGARRCGPPVRCPRPRRCGRCAAG